MSTSTPAISTGANGQPISGTTGTSVGNASATALNANDFLDLMLAQLRNQDPTNPSASDPTQFMSELAQMTSVEQETNTAQSTAEAAQEQAVSQAVALIGDTVTYKDPTTGHTTSGQVSSVQITSSGPTLTVGTTSGVAPSSVTEVTASGQKTAV